MSTGPRVGRVSDSSFSLSVGSSVLVKEDTPSLIGPETSPCTKPSLGLVRGIDASGEVGSLGTEGRENVPRPWTVKHPQYLNVTQLHFRGSSRRRLLYLEVSGNNGLSTVVFLTVRLPVLVTRTVRPHYRTRPPDSSTETGRTGPSVPVLDRPS